MASCQYYYNRQAISPTTELDRYILKQMCILYAGGIQEQCACEYWSDGREARVTEIYKLSLAQKNNLRLKNLNCEILYTRDKLSKGCAFLNEPPEQHKAQFDYLTLQIVGKCP